MTVAGDLAQFLIKTAFEDLPPLAIERAKMVIASTLASAAAGSEIGSAAIIRSLARERAGTEEASIWFDAGPKLPVADVARVNAMMSDAAASDDSDLRTIAHIGTIITATSIATAERTDATGRDVLAAMVLGYEAAGRIGELITPGYGERGFHGCVVTIFAGAVASARLLRLSQPQMAQALAIAATSIGGLAVAANTSLAREYHAGLSAMLGVNAALAAQKGYVAEETIFETRGGFFDAFGGTDRSAAPGGRDVGSVTRDWAKEWDITTDMAIKLVPGAHSYHAVAEAAVNAARAADVKPEEVESITISGPQFATVRGPLHATDLISAAHSLSYFLAAAVADKDFSWVHASPAKMADPRIRALAEKVRAADPAQAVEDRSRHRRGGTVTITTADGRRYASTVEAPRGSGPRGIDWADVDAKYRTLVPVAKLSAPRIEQSLALIHDFDRVQHGSELIDLLR